MLLLLICKPSPLVSPYLRHCWPTIVKSAPLYLAAAGSKRQQLLRLTTRGISSSTAAAPTTTSRQAGAERLKRNPQRLTAATALTPFTPSSFLPSDAYWQAANCNWRTAVLKLAILCHPTSCSIFSFISVRFLPGCLFSACFPSHCLLNCSMLSYWPLSYPLVIFLCDRHSSATSPTDWSATQLCASLLVVPGG